jgi:hypothetical protein
MDRDDRLKVIGHDYKFVEGRVAEVSGDFFPLLFGDPSDGGEMHDFVADDSEVMFSVPGTDGDEVESMAGVIPGAAADAFDSVFFSEKRHVLLHDRYSQEFLQGNFKNISPSRRLAHTPGRRDVTCYVSKASVLNTQSGTPRHRFTTLPRAKSIPQESVSNTQSGTPRVFPGWQMHASGVFKSSGL